MSVGTTTIDFSELLGFSIVSGQIAEGLDFQNEHFDAALGAKIGPPTDGDGVEPISPVRPTEARLGTKVREENVGITLFQEENLAATLGAKVGFELID